MECKNKDHEIYPYYGLAPHKHSVNEKGEMETFFSDSSEWPISFIEDKDSKGCGVYHCPDCFSLTSK